MKNLDIVLFIENGGSILLH